MCALAAVAAGAYLAADRLDALLWQSAAVTCVLILLLHAALRRVRRDRRTEPAAGGAKGAEPEPRRPGRLPERQPVALPADEGAAPRP